MHSGKGTRPEDAVLHIAHLDNGCGGTQFYSLYTTEVIGFSKTGNGSKETQFIQQHVREHATYVNTDFQYF